MPIHKTIPDQGPVRGTGVTLWRQIQKFLEEDIATSRFGPGERLPSEQDLASRFGVNRHTVRRALAALEHKGIIRCIRGSGSFVQEKVVTYSLARRVRFSENLLRQNRLPGGELIHHVSLAASREVAEKLRIRPGSPVLCLEVSGEADNQCICLTTHYIPQPRFPDLVEQFREFRSITACYRAGGVEDYLRKSTLITARMPTPFETSHLAQSKTRPVVVAECVNTDMEGIPIEYGITRWASELVQFEISRD
jgi:GntR family phosphonate transport system transcriptional regulator